MKKTLQVFNFSIQNAGSDAVDIHIDGDIVDASTQAMYEDWFGDSSSVSFKSFRNQISNSAAQTYNVYINSPGGLVTDAMAMHDFLIELQSQGKTVNTIGRGIVASAATYILMAGKNAEMSKNSWFMVHNVAGGMFGDVNEMERYVSTMRQFNDRARDFYAEYTGMRKEDITKLMNNETWMTADEAKEKGFIKKVSGDASFKNVIKAEEWGFSNQSILNSYNAAVKPQAENNDPKSFFQQQFDDMKKFFTDIVNGIRGVKPAEGADQTALVNQIADAMQGPLEKVGDEIESQIANALKGDAITNAVAEAVKPFENRIKQLETAKTDLEKKNGELEQEITNVKGGASNGGKVEEGPKPIGGFKK